jgi:MOSC domain-containing protein YiiM
VSTLSEPALISAVNVGGPAEHEWLGHAVTTAIFKYPVSGRVAIAGVNITGDDQADRDVHGGPDKAVYAYAAEDTQWWEARLGRPLGPGAFGENLTTRGLDLTGAVVGERWRVGSAILEVSQPRLPCFKLGLRMADRHFPRRFAAAVRPGAYLRILGEGHVGAADTVEVVSRPAHGVTVGMVSRAYFDDRSLVTRLLSAPELPKSWLDWAFQRP